jgi:CRISPR-associated endonuclease Cas2
MSIVGEILQELWDSEFYYKGVRVNFFGIPRFKKYAPNSIQVSLSRLQKKGYIASNNKEWYLTSSGKTYIKKNTILKQFDFEVSKNAPKNLMVMFDIPEPKKKEREWFRRHLRKLGYVMVQKSVWVGPSPLPKEFTEYTKQIKLQDSIKTFKLAKGYNHV